MPEAKNETRGRWKLWVGYAVSVAALVLIVRFIHVGELATALKGARLGWLLPTLATLVTTQLLRTWRWSVLLQKSPFGATLAALSIGYMLNILLPFRLGEIARAYVVSVRSEVTMPRAISVTVLERMLDLAAAVLLLGLSILFVPVPQLFVRAATLGALLVVAGVVGCGVLVWQGRRAANVVAKILARIAPSAAEKWTKRFVDLCDGFRDLGSARRIGGVVLLTVVTWASIGANTYFCMEMFLDAQPAQTLLVVAAMNIGAAVPAAPGGVGVMQAFAETALVVPFGVDPDRALAFVIVCTIGQQALLVGAGFLGLLRVGMSFREIRGASH